jgi:predicted DNA-binding protein
MNAITLSSPKKSDLKIFADLAKRLNISARFIETCEIEEVEDFELATEIQEALKTGFADTNGILKKMGIKTSAN